MQIQNPLQVTSDGGLNVVAPVKVKYCLYARKSTESEERQILSIDSQVKEMLQLADREGLEIVVIKRESAVLRPTSAEVKPVEIQNEMGAKRTVSEGNFTFPFSAFDPSAPITVVLIGDAGNFEWPVTREELARMK